MNDFLSSLVDRARGEGDILRPMHPIYRSGETELSEMNREIETPIPQTTSSKELSTFDPIERHPESTRPESLPHMKFDSKPESNIEPSVEVQIQKEIHEVLLPTPISMKVILPEKSISKVVDRSPQTIEKTNIVQVPFDHPVPVPIPISKEVKPSNELIPDSVTSTEIVREIVPISIDRTIPVIVPISKKKPNPILDLIEQSPIRPSSNTRPISLDPLLETDPFIPIQESPIREEQTRHITVSIGRLEVRVSPNANVTPKPVSEGEKPTSLQQYLRQRQEGGSG
jgi:hypothetical protein